MWSIPGLIANPDFGVGDAASAELVLGVDMNGWHALSGFAVAIPALLLLRRPDLEAVYITLAAASLIATGVWALFDTQPAAGLFSFPHNGTDALLHFGTSAIYLAGAAHWFATSRLRPEHQLGHGERRPARDPPGPPGGSRELVRLDQHLAASGRGRGGRRVDVRDPEVDVPARRTRSPSLGGIATATRSRGRAAGLAAHVARQAEQRDREVPISKRSVSQPNTAP